MNSQSNQPRDPHDSSGDESRRQRNEEARHGAPESPQSRETFPERERKPGEVGLANEARPGLGTRADEERTIDDGVEPLKRKREKQAEDKSKPKATPYAYEEPRPQPREQESDSMEHEQERSTGVSGHMGG